MVTYYHIELYYYHNRCYTSVCLLKLALVVCHPCSFCHDVSCPVLFCSKKSSTSSNQSQLTFTEQLHDCLRSADTSQSSNIWDSARSKQQNQSCWFADKESCISLTQRRLIWKKAQELRPWNACTPGVQDNMMQNDRNRNISEETLSNFGISGWSSSRDACTTHISSEWSVT